MIDTRDTEQEQHWIIIYTLGDEDIHRYTSDLVSPDKKGAILQFLCSLRLTHRIEHYISETPHIISDRDVKFLMNVPGIVHYLDLDDEELSTDILQDRIACGLIDSLSIDDFVTDEDAEHFMNIVLNTMDYDSLDSFGVTITVEDIIKRCL